MSIQVDVWGDFACFTLPYTRIERVTSPVPTPSAIRGILDSIYCKPSEFFWSVLRIEVMKPIKYICITRNEPSVPMSMNTRKPIVPFDSNGKQQLRQTVMLKDVRYRITAEIVRKSSCPQDKNEGGIVCQARRRIEKGQCYQQPFFGLRELEACFSNPEPGWTPISDSADYGFMLYDVFNLNPDVDWRNSKPDISMYHCVMKNGVIEVPRYDSPNIIRTTQRGVAG